MGVVVIETVFRSEDLPTADRFAYWRECMSHLIAPMEMTSDHASDFRAEMRLLELGALQVWPTNLQPMRFERTPRLICQSDPEMFHLSLILHGAMHVSQADQHVTHRRYGLYIVDSSLPCDSQVVEGQVVGIGVEIPKALLPLPHNRAGRLLGRSLSGREGIGGLLAGFLTRLVRDTSIYQLSDGPRLGTVLIDLLSALFAHTLDAERALSPETHRRVLTLRIRAFIQQHLHEPHLTATAIAAAHHISVSYLHRLFQTEGETVTAWIRGQRLERVRRDLANSALRTVPIHDIASRWGYTDPAAFSRAFRATHGIPPRDYRHQALHTPR
jgi:AraC-like DNA-binding protein